MYDNDCYGSNDDGFWLGYMVGNGSSEDDGMVFIWLIQFYFFGLQAGTIGYNLGKILIDVNIVKWGLAILFGLISIVFFGKLISYVVDNVIDYFDNNVIRVLLALVVSLVLAILFSYLLAQAGHQLFENEKIFIISIENYEKLIKWLLSK